MTVRWYRPLALAACAVLLAPLASSAQPAAPEQLQIDQIFSANPLLGKLPASITWSPDGSRFLYTLPDGTPRPVDTHVFNVKTGTDAIFFRAKAEGKGSRPVAEFVWSPDSTHLAYLDGGDLWIIDASGAGKRKLADGADDPQWSPDGTRIAYVHESDLYAVPAHGGASERFSFDGKPDVTNGDPDWVYSEELGMRHAYRWSPDGAHIAYLQFDQRPIAPFPIVDFLDTVNTANDQRYPLAGGKNSIVTLRVAAPGGATRTLYSTRAHGDYLASVDWTPSGAPTAQILDRAQQHLRYVEFLGSAPPRTLLAESDPKWVAFLGTPRWLHDKTRFLFTSERDGVASLYIANAHTGAVKRLTSGFRVGGEDDDGILGVDEHLRVAIVNAAYPTRRDRTALVVSLRGGEARPLARGHGAHDFIFAPDARHFVRIDSSYDVPPTYTVGNTLDAQTHVLAQAKSLARFGFAPTELGQIDSPAGKLDTVMIKPANFDPGKKYPVITYVYGGPAAPETGDAYGGATYLYHELLAQHGFIVFIVDGHGSQTDSAAAVRTMYHALGPVSLAGQLAGAAYLKTLPYVDPTRLGIWGWSFGGYETTYALTHAPDVWKVGVAVAPVTDWSFYDTIYTERYMGTPQAHPSAYAASSVLPKAGALRGRLLISHGTSDDNVHMANTINLLQAFVLTGRQVDFMVYPRKTHSIAGIPQRRHLFGHMLQYWEDHL